MINSTELDEIKTKLAKEGVGSKGRLAKTLKVNRAQISLLLKSGYITEAKEKSLRKWLKDEKS